MVHPLCLHRPLTAAELLRGVASARGWVVGNGLPDEARAGRLLLKDYTDGRLLHCEWPPSGRGGAEDAGSSGRDESSSGSDDGEGDDDERGSRHAEAGAGGTHAAGVTGRRDAQSSRSDRPPGEDAASEQGAAGHASAAAAAPPQQPSSLPADSASELGEADLDLLQSLAQGVD